MINKRSSIHTIFKLIVISDHYKDEIERSTQFLEHGS